MRATKIYLACPFSVLEGHSKEWEVLRFRCVNIAAMALINKGFKVFSPISHSSPIADTNPESRNTHKLWLEQDVEFLMWCDKVIVLKLPGWRESYGVQWEIAWAAEHRKPTVFLTLEEIYQMEMEALDEKDRQYR